MFRARACIVSLLGLVGCWSAAASNVSLTASPNPAVYGQAVTLTAAVTAGATGKVTFYDGVKVLGVANVTAGTASFSTVLLPQGSRRLRAYYGGDAGNGASTSNTFTENITAMAANVLAQADVVTNISAGAVTANDLNGDGKADLIVVGGNGLQIFPGNGDGSFSNVFTVTEPLRGFGTHQIEVADFNGDGKPDVAVTQQNPNSVLVMLGNGDGTFQASTGYAVSEVPMAVLAGDFNRDGKADLAALTQNAVRVFMGNGDGSLQPAVQYSTGGFSFDFRSGDFHGNGITDLVINTYTGLTVLPGNGDGTFGSMINYGDSFYSGVLLVADLNSDGRDDVAFASFNGIVTRLTASDGTFYGENFVAPGLNFQTLVAGDFNGDGNIDLAWSGAGYLVFAAGNGFGGFPVQLRYDTAYTPSGIVTGDFNRDGRTDLAMVSLTAVPGSSALSVMRGVSATAAVIGAGQSTPLGMPFGAAIQLKLTDGGGIPVSGVPVSFSIPPMGAGATLSSMSGVTDAQGLATVTATANNTAGSYDLFATVGFGMTTAINLTNYAVVPATITPVAGTPQSVAVGMPFPVALQIVLKDAGGQPVSGAAVLFSSPSNGAGAFLSAGSVMTDASGLARVLATANQIAGTYTVSAGIGALSTPFTLTNIASAGVTLTATPNPSVLGGIAILTATVPSGATGKVTFYDGTAVLGTRTVSGQTATLSTALLPAGNRKLRAYYVGDGSHPAAASSLVTQTVNGAASTAFSAGGAYTIPGVFTLGRSPNFVAVGDLNGDGRNDLAVANNNSDTVGSVTILLGNGDGTFQAGVNCAVGGAPASLVLADFDGDGKTDVAVPMYNTNAVTILLGNGDGTLRAGATYSTGDRPYKVFGADLNRDGFVDLAIPNYMESTVSVLFGNGDGTFRQAVAINSGALHSQSVVIEDFNGDGIADLAVGNSDTTTASIMMGNGDGSFQSPRQVAVSPGSDAAAQSLAAGDFNGDGKMDLAAVGVFSWSLMLGNGDGTFQAPRYTQHSTWTANAFVADFNADGNLDLAFSYGNSGAQGIGMLLGRGDGTFQPLQALPGTTSLYSVTAGELNGDGRMDLLFVDGPNRAVRVLLGSVPGLDTALTHSGTFMQGQTGRTYSIVVTNHQMAATSGSVMVTDTLPAGLTGIAMSGTGWTCTVATLICTRSDALAAGASYSPITLTVDVAGNAPAQVVNQVTLSGGGAGPASANDPTTIVVGYPTVTTLTVSPSPSNLGQNVTLTASVGGGPIIGTVTFYDGTTLLGMAPIDFITMRAALSTNMLPVGVRSLRARYSGDGVNAPSTSLPYAQTVRAASAIALAPLNGYGVIGNAYSIAVGDLNRDGKIDLAVANGTGVSVLLGAGNAVFQEAVNYPANAAATFVTLADFNGDGKLDMVTANPSNNSFSVFGGNGDGSFQAAVNYTGGSSPKSLAAGDFNGDGLADLAVANSGNNTVSIYMGGSVLSPLATYPVGSNPYSVVVADFNGDAKADLAVINRSGSVSILPGNGNGTFQAATTFTAGSGPVFGVAGDFNGDGKTDLAIANESGSSLGVMIGRGDGTFVSAVNYTVGSSPVSIAMGDFDGDGKQDLAVASGGGRGVSTLLGNGDGTFRPGTSYSAGSSATGIVVGDFNGDGRTDMAITIGNSITVAPETRVHAAERVATAAGGNVLILAGSSVNPAGAGLRFVAITPCRIADTRGATGTFGGPNLAAAVGRDFDVRGSACGIPANAQAYSLNLTVVPLGMLGFLSVWPAGLAQPTVSTLNSTDGRVKANAAIVPAGTNGAITLFGSNATHAIIDINGYFVPAVGSNNLAFYPMTPCRVTDTRIGTGALAGPALAAGVERSFPIRSSGCGVPAAAQAYAMNMTVVPAGPLGFLSAWPAGSPQPGASTLNAPTGTVTANAAIVPAGTNGAISLIATNATDVIIDINGYFAPPGAGGMQFYPATPCRILDTRGAAGAFGGPQLQGANTREFTVAASACGIPGLAGAFSLNATVVPPGPMGFLSLWGPGGQPGVSTLNASDGSVVANAALVPASSAGSVNAFASHSTQLILDINGYFAQ